MNNKESLVKKFYEVADYLENYSDITMTNKANNIVEKGISVNKYYSITYNKEHNNINFFNNDNRVILSLDPNSPLITMFEDLILAINDMI